MGSVARLLWHLSMNHPDDPLSSSVSQMTSQYDIQPQIFARMANIAAQQESDGIRGQEGGANDHPEPQSSAYPYVQHPELALSHMAPHHHQTMIQQIQQAVPAENPHLQVQDMLGLAEPGFRNSGNFHQRFDSVQGSFDTFPSFPAPNYSGEEIQQYPSSQGYDRRGEQSGGSSFFPDVSPTYSSRSSPPASETDSVETPHGLLMEGDDDDRVRLVWTPELHDRFETSVNFLGGIWKATPKAIQYLMNVEGLTKEHIKSHLQKYRRAMKHEKNKAGTLPANSNTSPEEMVGKVASGSSSKIPKQNLDEIRLPPAKLQRRGGRLTVVLTSSLSTDSNEISEDKVQWMLAGFKLGLRVGVRLGKDGMEDLADDKTEPMDQN